jgi:DNA-binding CsgD family transcriptional regulator
MGPLWSAEEHAQLVELAAKGMTPGQMAAEIGRSEMSVKCRCAKHKIRTLRADGVRRWTEAEIAKARELAAQGISGRKIGKQLGRSLKSIYATFCQHGIHLGSSAPWNDEHLAFLAANASTMTAREIGDRLRRSDKSVRHKAKVMGLALKMAQSTPAIKSVKSGTWQSWDDQHIQFLQAHAAELTKGQMATILGRTVRAVEHRAGRMGLRFVRKPAALRPARVTPEKTQPEPIAAKKPPTRSSSSASYVSRLAYCPECHAPVVNTWESWQAHNARLGHGRQAKRA